MNTLYMTSRYNFVDNGKYTELVKSQDIIENLEEQEEDEETSSQGTNNTFKYLQYGFCCLLLVGSGIFYKLNYSESGGKMIVSMYKKLKKKKVNTMIEMFKTLDNKARSSALEKMNEVPEATEDEDDEEE